MTSGGEAYWSVVNSGVEANYDLFPASGTGIINVDFEYNATTSNPLLPHHVVNDISVVEGSPNLLGFATNLGAFIVEEQQLSEASSQTLTLFPQSDPAVSVDFSQDATFSGGHVYVAVADSVHMFRLVDATLSGSHFYDPFEDSLRDQTLITGTVTIIRTTNVS
jgi:hypothetical protein